MIDPALALTPEHLKHLSAVSLAYVGDAVYELFVRQAALWPPRRLEEIHRQVVQRVQAPAQAHILTCLWQELTPAEHSIALWGRNGSGKGSALARQASAWETLIGYLYVTDPQRLEYLLLRSLTIEIPQSLP
ncbi:MAG: hypothetical protein Q6J68_03180 [Thermostichales cyanobacterium SZTDM-1c_bins_54]